MIQIDSGARSKSRNCLGIRSKVLVYRALVRVLVMALGATGNGACLILQPDEIVTDVAGFTFVADHWVW